MKTKRSRYQQGNIRKVPRARGFAWEVRFSETINGKRKQKSLYFDSSEYPTEASVRRAIEHQVALVNVGTERAKVAAKFGNVIALYRKDKFPQPDDENEQEGDKLRHSTQSLNDYLLKNYIEPEWESHAINNVTPLRVETWLKGLSMAATTKSNVRSILRQCFELAAKHGFIPATERNPMSLVEIKGTRKRRKLVTILTEDQFKTLVDALPSPFKVMVLLDGVLGLRVGDLLALHWEDFDFKEKTVTIQRNFTRQKIGEPKTDKSHATLPLDDALVSILKQHKKTTKDTALLFPSPRTGKYLAAGTLMTKSIQPVATKIGIGKISWHGLRHSCRTWLDAKGVPVGVQKDLLRHADVSTTMNRYGRALPAEMRSAQSAIIAALLPASMVK